MLTAAQGRPGRGFTLVELMVVVAIIALGATLAVPGLAQMVANYKVRGAADGILTGLNLARAEALRRNTAVSFALASSGAGWSVSQVSSSAVLQSRSGNDAAGVTVASSSSATSVTFLATGLLETGTQLSQVTVSSLVGATDSRRINIYGGGLIRMCDPAVAAAGDPRKC